MTVDSLDKSLDQLRTLRRRAATLHAHVADDLRPFLNGDLPTFRRLPMSAHDKDDANVSTTSTALMTLAATRKLRPFYGDKGPEGKAFEAIKAVVEDKEWASSKLPKDNAFTKIMVLRAAGLLARDGELKADSLLKLSHNGKTLADILKETAEDAPKTFKVQHYDPTPTLGYWFVDAINALQCVDRVPQKNWEELTKWTATQFTSQISLLVARHETLMDPVAMAMAACLASRLRSTLNSIDENWARKLLEALPSRVELREGVRRFFQEQLPSGIWPKYFPLFHYPEAGSNFTFTFELLEAVLREFGSDPVLEEQKILEGLERAVRWCEGNRLDYYHGGRPYLGWNSGGVLSTLIQGLPECWATGVVHMFLSQLGSMLTDAIQRRLLERYRAVRPIGADRTGWNSMLDTSVELQDKRTITVRALIEEHILNALTTVRDAHEKIESRHSALLFGPPGTSKTSLVKNFAKAAGWPYVEINPSHFLSRGLDEIYIRANEIFADLMELSHVVVLFDEMDTLVHRRPGDAKEQPLDVTREFLTTSMLPKLADIHSHGRIVFFMATNHQERFDEAIKRPGRFDLHVFMGVPSWQEKRNALYHFISGLPEDGKERNTELTRIGDALDGWLKEHKDAQELLNFFSFGEMKAFFDDFIGRKGLSDAFSNGRGEEFRNNVRNWGKSLITLREYENPSVPEEKRKKNELRVEYDRDREKTRIQ